MTEFETDIPFTQYLRPDGRRTEVLIDRPADICELARKIIDLGYRFECEHLRTDHASLTISNRDGDAAIEVVPNGPQVTAAVDRLVMNFAKKIGIK